MQSAIQPAVKLVFDDKMFASLAPETQKSLGDQREFGLLFTFDAIAKAENLTGLPLLSGMTRQQIETPTIGFMRALLYAGLCTCEPEITRTESDALLTLGSWRPAWSAVLTAWVDAQPDLEDEESGEIPADPPAGQS